MDFITRVKSVFIAVFSALASWLGILYVPVITLVVSNIIDYATGLCAAKCRAEHVNSYKSIRGITKKICMWLLVAIGVMLDRLMNFAAAEIGIILPLHFITASVTAVWLTANELISILENINDIGVDLPPFLMRIAKNVKSQTEDAAEKETSDERKSN